MNKGVVRLRRVTCLGLIGLVLTACAPGSVPSPLTRDLPWPFSSPQNARGEMAPDDPVRDAIQLVIMRGNIQQEQAIAARDPSVMRESATNSHFQELARTNATLLESGVTRVRLDALEWGPIRANGTTAQATTYETWTAELADGTIQQSRDRNLYRLVKQDDAWKVQSNEHPDTDGAAPPSPPSRRDPAGPTRGPNERRDQERPIVPRGTQTQA